MNFNITIEIFHDGKMHDLLLINLNDIMKLYERTEEERAERCLPLKSLENRDTASLNGDACRLQFIKDYLDLNDSGVLLNSNRQYILMRECFLLCIYLDSFKEAVQLVERTEEPIVSCLVGAMIYRKAARLLTCTDTKRSREFKNNAEKFSELAGQKIDEKVSKCRFTERQQNEMLERCDEYFFNLTPLELIENNSCQGIHLSDVLHSRLHKIFYGDLNNRHYLIHLRVFHTTLFLPLLPCLLIIPGLIPFRTNKLTFLEKLKRFYHAPVVQFYYYYVFYVGFLMIYGYNLATRYLPYNIWGNRIGKTTYLKIGRSETIVHIWIWNLIVEEVFEFIQNYLEKKNLRTYFQNKWNRLDLSAISFYLVAFVTRFGISEEAFITSKVLMSISFLLWCLRMLHMFTAYEMLGWSLVVIFRMMKSLVFFFAVLIIIIFAFAVPVEALRSTPDQVRWYRSPDGTQWNATIKRLVYWGILRLFGQMEDPSDDNSVWIITGWCLTVLFACVIHILLLNALIVIFNMVAKQAEDKLKSLWRSQQAMLVKEFCDKSELYSPFKRSLVPPPLNVIYYVVRMIYKSVQYIRKHGCAWLYTISLCNCQRN